MRPLATSWPPERRLAAATGAAHRFSHTSPAADVPRSSAGPDPREAFPPDAYETLTVPVVPLDEPVIGGHAGRFAARLAGA